ncbi:hypothetical protein DFQ05_1094 [Winogradskyella wandonensis]|uniref:PsbP protein n=1 Tax=Winogradskyella wandonensis TaxID=1442586 RepID=A0A4R1KRW1_9FLAO|nr:hypothetical protein [Winogradskyella wandonensis]TCK67320.1 hypothetical protein DFQ05_1094 [Winogradskyella wandonensis]
MKIRILTLALCITTTFAFAQEMKTYTKDNLTIDYDATWEISEQKMQPAVKFMILSDASSQISDSFRENINLSSESLQGQKMTATEYAKISLDQITSQIPTAKIISNESKKINGLDVQEIIWSADFGNNMILKFKQVAFVRGGEGYVFTFTSTTAEFDKYVESADKMFSSFKFVN